MKNISFYSFDFNVEFLEVSLSIFNFKNLIKYLVITTIYTDTIRKNYQRNPMVANSWSEFTGASE